MPALAKRNVFNLKTKSHGQQNLHFNSAMAIEVHEICKRNRVLGHDLYLSSAALLCFGDRIEENLSEFVSKFRVHKPSLHMVRKAYHAWDKCQYTLEVIDVQHNSAWY